MTVKEAKEIIKMANKIVVLTGAGISTESGLPDRRRMVLKGNEVTRIG